jgi:hypothetical protein
MPHPRNVPGPFYVVDGCCTACDVPVTEAPDLFAYDEACHCYVKRQPQSAEELDRALRAAWLAELQCIRYRGDDPEVLRRFAELGEPHLCDVPPPLVSPVVRDLVLFDSSGAPSAAALLVSFREFLVERNHQRENIGLDVKYHYRFGELIGDVSAASLDISWFEDNWHTVGCRRSDGHTGWCVRHFSADKVGGRGVSDLLDHWLKASDRFTDVRWLSSTQPEAPERPSPQ